MANFEALGNSIEKEGKVSKLEWYFMLLLFFGLLAVTMISGMPVAMAFMTANVIFMYSLWGGEIGLEQFILSLFASVASFKFMAIPLFILMGEVMFSADIAPKMLDSVDNFLGRIPGRLSLLAVGGGTLFAALTGTSIASVAMLGSSLVPEMEKRGYKKPMTLGPILGSGGLAMMIPPSTLAVLYGAVGEISIGNILIAIIVPGLVMAALYAMYIIIRCVLQPDLAPVYDVTEVSLLDKIKDLVFYVMPLGIIVFLVVGVIFFGIATPTEAAATGALGCFILTAAYGRLDWKLVKTAVNNTLSTMVMLFMIIAGSVAFSQILAFSGATQGLVEFALDLPVAPIFIPLAALVIVILLGMLISVTAIIVITVPLFLPVIQALGFDAIWFAVAMLIAIEMGVTSPPFGLTLFVMKGVAPSDTKIEDCYLAALPFLGCDLIALTLIFIFPQISLWLPGQM